MASVWQPSHEVRAFGVALQGAIPNVQGTMLTSDAVGDIQKPVQPGVRVLASFLRSHWGLSSAGTARGAAIRRPPRTSSGALRRRDVHEEGRAIDAMTTDVAKGTAIAEWCVRHAAALGIQYVIWQRTEWSSSLVAGAWEPYVGSSPHTDHVHLEVTPATAADGEAMRRAIGEITGVMPPSLSAPSSTRRQPSGPPAPAPSSSSARPEPDGASVAPMGIGLAALAAFGWYLRRKRRSAR